ncbi:MAG: hypothetical protein ACJ77A_09645 [Actinomycetota bacterium]
MFTPEERDRTRDRVLELAREDPRITGGAVTGSGSAGAEDRWSDIDLAFGVADEASPEAVLDDWTQLLTGELGVIHHWDLRRERTIYRVYLLPGGLELDIAVTPAAKFGAYGPRFRLMFGESVERPHSPPPSLDEIVGWGWIYAFTARTAIARERPWTAEYWISALRDQALALACLRLGEPTDYARGFHRLPSEVVAPYEKALVRSLEPAELRRALGLATQLFLAEVREHDPELGERLRAPLSDLLPT